MLGRYTVCLSLAGGVSFVAGLRSPARGEGATPVSLHRSAPPVLPVSNPASPVRRMLVYRTFYCSTGPGCDEPICGGDPRPALDKEGAAGGGGGGGARRV